MLPDYCFRLCELLRAQISCCCWVSCDFLDASGLYHAFSLFSAVLWAWSNVGLWNPAFVFISYWMKVLWWQLGLSPIYEYRRTLLGIITLTFSPFMFGSTLCLWTMQNMGPSTPGSIRSRLSLMTWVSGLARHWLFTPIIPTTPPLPQRMP